MIPKELLKKIRRIQITTSRAVTDVFAGQYKSVFKGQGMEFDEVREYQPGDEIRSIDWNVTARLGHPYVKKFVEERELTVMLLVDISRSMYCGSGRGLKRALSAEICSMLAFSAIKNNDRVGLILFSDKIEKFLPPGKGSKHVLRIIREVLYTSPRSTGTDIPAALEHLNKICKRKSVVFLLSDFFTDDLKKPLAIAGNRHDLVAVTINDPLEKELPGLGIVDIQDSETGQELSFDFSDEHVCRKYKEKQDRRTADLAKMFRSINIDNIQIVDSNNYVKELVKFFRAREKRRR